MIKDGYSSALFIFYVFEGLGWPLAGIQRKNVLQAGEAATLKVAVVTDLRESSYCMCTSSLIPATLNKNFCLCNVGCSDVFVEKHGLYHTIGDPIFLNNLYVVVVVVVVVV